MRRDTEVDNILETPFNVMQSNGTMPQTAVSKLQLMTFKQLCEFCERIKLKSVTLITFSIPVALAEM